MLIGLFEDEHISDLNPLVENKTVFEIVVGATQNLGRIKRIIGNVDYIYCREYLSKKLAAKAKGVVINPDIIDDEVLLVNGRVIDSYLIDQAKKLRVNSALLEGEYVIAIKLDRDKAKEFSEAVNKLGYFKYVNKAGLDRYEVKAGKNALLKYPWDLIAILKQKLVEDINKLPNLRDPPSNI